MKYQVDGWNNFCRVFALPEKFPSDYCFHGGHPVNFQMVDWFNPVPEINQPAISKKIWLEKYGKIKTKEVTEDDLRESLIPFLAIKQYIIPGREYLIICDFGASIKFSV